MIYASVGHAGASAYLAVMAFMNFAPDVMRPTALTLNILVSLVAFVNYYRKSFFDFERFWPLAITSIPMAFVGGTILIRPAVYNILIGLALVSASVRLLIKPKENSSFEPVGRVTLMGIGAAIGLLSGLTGIGGGIFLTPIFVFFNWAPIKLIAGISSAFILVNSIAGLAGNYNGLQFISPHWIYYAAVVLVGGALGSLYGANYARNLVLRRILFFILLTAGVKMLLT